MWRLGAQTLVSQLTGVARLLHGMSLFFIVGLDPKDYDERRLRVAFGAWVLRRTVGMLWVQLGGGGAQKRLGASETKP